MATAHSRPTRATRYDVEAIRAAFPAVQQEARPGVPLSYLDSAATSLKPMCVVDALQAYMAQYSANVHRGVHVLSEKATEAFENARERTARFLNVADSGQIVFTRGTTESVNLVAQSWARTNLKPGDQIVLTPLEHHSNMVPWQVAAQHTGAELVYTAMTPDGRVELDAFDRAIGERTRLVAMTGMSNVLGTVPPVAEVVALAHARGARVLLDGAQSVPHGPCDATALDVDFLVFSGHKMGGPTGVGVLYGKRALLEAMPPYQTGGSMVLGVQEQAASWNEIPWKFEAGTPPIGEVIALGAAIEFLESVDWEAWHAYERNLTVAAHRLLEVVPGLTIHGPAPELKGGILALTMDHVHPHDLAQIADHHGVAIRAGHHCAMPLHKRLNLVATARASFYLYSTIEEVERLAAALTAAHDLFSSRRRPAGGRP